MKVLKPGREQKGWSTEQVCTGKGNGNGGCGAILLVEIGDVFETQQNCRDETDYFTTFRCPCGVLTDLGDVPSHVQDAARRQKAKWHESSTSPEPDGGMTKTPPQLAAACPRCHAPVGQLCRTFDALFGWRKTRRCCRGRALAVRASAPPRPVGKEE